MPREGTPVRITQSMRGRPRKVVLTVHFKGDADAVAEAQQEERITQEEVAIPEVLPLLPIRDKVYFPHVNQKHPRKIPAAPRPSLAQEYGLQ